MERFRGYYCYRSIKLLTYLFTFTTEIGEGRLYRPLATTMCVRVGHGVEKT